MTFSVISLIPSGLLHHCVTDVHRLYDSGTAQKRILGLIMKPYIISLRLHNSGLGNFVSVACLQFA